MDEFIPDLVAFLEWTPTLLTCAVLLWMHGSTAAHWGGLGFLWCGRWQVSGGMAWCRHLEGEILLANFIWICEAFGKPCRAHQWSLDALQTGRGALCTSCFCCCCCCHCQMNAGGKPRPGAALGSTTCRGEGWRVTGCPIPTRIATTGGVGVGWAKRFRSWHGICGQKMPKVTSSNFFLEVSSISFPIHI